MYSIVLMTALAAGQSTPAGWFSYNPNNWWCRYGAGYGGCYGVSYGGWPETGSLCAPPALGAYDGGPVPMLALPAPPPSPEFSRGAEVCPGKGAAEVQPIPPDRARLIVTLPGDARLYVDDQPIQTATPERSFRTPELEKGRVYYYEVRAEMMRDGKPVSETRRVKVKAGDVVRTDFRSLGQASEVVSVK